jgi:hypothetical protein
MKIKSSIGKTTTTLQWQFLENKISLKFPGRVEAEYSELKDLVVVVGGDGVIRLVKTDGNQSSEFSYKNSEDCKFYALIKSARTDLGVSIVMAHTPEYKGERFWQHDINIESKTVGDPIEKWR